MSKSFAELLGDASGTSDGLSAEECFLVQAVAEGVAEERKKTKSAVKVMPCKCEKSAYRGLAHVHFVITRGRGENKEVLPFGPVFLRPTGKALLQQLVEQGFITPEQVAKTIPVLETHIQAEHMSWPPNAVLDGLEETWAREHVADGVMSLFRE